MSRSLSDQWPHVASVSRSWLGVVAIVLVRFAYVLANAVCLEAGTASSLTVFAVKLPLASGEELVGIHMMKACDMRCRHARLMCLP